jgi:hypothetical protein
VCGGGVLMYTLCADKCFVEACIDYCQFILNVLHLSELYSYQVSLADIILILCYTK